MNQAWKLYQSLELLPESSTSSARSPLLRQWWQQQWRWFNQSQYSMPVIWKTLDRQKNTRWNIFDPATGRTMFLLSEQAFQSWFTKRYF
ncbi:MAG: hypothetical protein AAGE59_06730 [Cyanobacteria bacterium P01_F01_bin.86]